MLLSILVVSRTPELLNQLVASLDQAYSGPADQAQILCSWNGSPEDENQIKPGRIPLAIAQRNPYHFASNMNRLGHKANGDILIFTNDDLIPDPGAVDAALDRLKTRPEVGIVGARLRTSSGQLAHAGIHFTAYGSPYHQLEHIVDADHPANHRERLVPAVTGAFFAMRRTNFLALEFAESFRVCGEDVLLCLQTRSTLNLEVLYCPAMSGIHNAETTRSHFQEQQGNEDDVKRLRSGWLEMMQHASKETLRLELKAAQDEAEDLRGRCFELMGEIQKLQAHTETLHRSLQLAGRQAKQELEQSLLEGENRRLRSRIQQLENQLVRPSCQV